MVVRFTSKKVEEVITRILHDEGLVLLEVLKGKENISEFDIAKKMKKDIKVVRRMLYLLYNSNLVTFTRKKDKQKGWYVYYWTLDIASIKFNYIRERREQLLRFKELLDREEKELFYISPDGSVRLNFDDAMEFDFQCPETGELMVQDDNAQRVSDLKNKILETDQEIKEWEISEIERIKLVSKKVEEERKKEEALEKKTAAEKKKKTVKKPVVKAVTKKKATVKKKEVKAKPTAEKKKKTVKKDKTPPKKKVIKKKTPKKTVPEKPDKKVKAKKSPASKKSSSTKKISKTSVKTKKIPKKKIVSKKKKNIKKKSK